MPFLALATSSDAPYDRTMRLLVAMLLVTGLGLLAGCGSGGGGSSSSSSAASTGTTATTVSPTSTEAPPSRPSSGSGTPPTAGELAAGKTWAGTFTIRLETWNYCGTGGADLTLASTSSRAESFTFSTGKALSDGQGGTESNPFSFSGGTDPARAGSLNLSIFSSLVLAVDKQGTRRLLHQYWTFEYRDGKLTGRLVDNGVKLGAASNGFTDADDLVPCRPQLGSIPKYYALDDGATLTADLARSHMTLTLDGRSVDQQRRFHIEADADAE